MIIVFIVGFSFWLLARVSSSRASIALAVFERARFKGLIRKA
jgi:hypothetical protein